MGHPDKVADQISDALLDSLLEHDPKARSAIETLVTTGLTVVAGEVTVHTHEAREALGRAEEIVRETIRKIGYDDAAGGFDYRSCAVLRTFHSQSEDISQGVSGQGLYAEQGAGDQGLMFGFACDETESLMPMPIQLAHRLVEHLAELREQRAISWLRPDAKSQVTVRYADGRPVGLHTIVVSTQHTEEVLDPSNPRLMSKAAKQRVIDEVIRPVVQRECAALWSDDIIFHINPTGRFVTGGPHGDTGLTGRKIIVDTYGGRGRHGGGAFSGKDPTKVDRSAAYMARHIAKNIVAAGLARQCEVQIAYAIGVAEPVSVAVDTFATESVDPAKIPAAVREVFQLKPAQIIKYLNLQRPIYFQTARHGHFGRKPEKRGKAGTLFTWERTDKAAELKRAVK